MDGRLQGTTLLELLLVLTIVVSLSLFSFGSLKNTQNRSEAQQFSHVLLRSLSYARQRAISTGERITLCASLDQQRCQREWYRDMYILVFTDRNQNRQADKGDIIHQARKLSLRHGSGHWRGSAGRTYQRFRVDGSAVEFGRYTYCPYSKEPAHFRQLVINHVGRAYSHLEGGGKTGDCQ